MRLWGIQNRNHFSLIALKHATITFIYSVYGMLASAMRRGSWDGFHLREKPFREDRSGGPLIFAANRRKR